MEKIYNVNLNLSNKNSVFALFRVVQGDNITRKIVASLYDENGDAYTPGTGVTAEYWSQKPDKTGTSHSAELSGSTVTITLTEQDTAAVGDVYATVKLKKNSEVLSAIPFRFKVEAFPTGDNVPSTSDYQTLVEATEAAEQATADAEEATMAANTAAEYATEAADTASNYNINLLAEGYSASKAYAIGDYCIYQGALYRCVVGITAEAWTADHWEAVELGSDVADLYYKIYDSYVHDTASGVIVSVPDGADDIPVKTMAIGIEPVQSGSGDPSPSNVRPISGWTQTNITRTGFNQWDEEWELGSLNASGDTYADATAIRSKNYIPVETGLEYFFVSTFALKIRLYDSTKNFVSAPSWPSGGNLKLTIPNGVSYLRFATQSGYGDTYKNDISINYPSTAVTYEPYKGNTYPVTLPDTVYGGELTINRDGTGTLVVDRAYWKCTATNTTMRTGGFRFYSNPTPIGEQPGSHSNNIISDRIPTATDTQLRDTGNIQELFCYIHDTSGGINFNTSSVYASVSDMIAEIGEIEFVYKMKDAITYTLTAPQVRTLLGVNNIWADTGDIESAVYPCDTKLYVDKEIAELQALVLENISNS